MDKRQIGGISILLGNLTLFVNGLIGYYKSQDENIRKAGIGRMTSAAMWSVGGILLARYGSRPVPQQLGKLQEKLAAFLQKEGVSLEEEAQRKAKTYNGRSWLQKFEDVLYNYPIESANIYNSIAAGGMIGSGIYRRKGTAEDIRSGNANFLTSGLTFGGTLASILIPERTPEQIAARGQSGTLWGKMQEQPLNYAVWMFLGADVATGSEAIGEYEKAKKLTSDDPFRPWAYGMSALSVFSMCCDVVGDLLTGFSSKKAGGTAAEHAVAKEQLLQETARMLSAQPLEKQQQLARKSAEYLSRQPELRMVDTIAAFA